MKLKVLSIGRDLEHDCIELASFEHARVFTDYDAVVLDPSAIRALWAEVEPSSDKTLITDLGRYDGLGGRVAETMERRLGECNDFLHNDGLVICYLRPVGEPLTVRKTSSRGYQDSTYSIYHWLPDWRGTTILSLVRAGSGSRVSLRDTHHPFSRFIRAHINDPGFGFCAYIDERYDCHTIAVNGGEKPVAFDPSFKSGHVVFLPAFETYDQRKEAGILLDCIRSMLTDSGTSEPPAWVHDHDVPGQGRHAAEISDLNDQIAKLENRKALLEQQENDLAQFRGLLYEQGRFHLEPVVRRAFRTLGFEVPEFEDYPEDWDVILRSPEGNAVAEAEGRDGAAVDRDKFRQLLDYKVEWVENGYEYKGILVVNGYRLADPSSRDTQITEAALRGCVNQRFCVLPTTELFKAVCMVLEQPENEQLKRQIRLSILETVGLYNFHEPAASAQSSTSGDEVTI